jgi:four helix bundle protein
MTSKDLYTRLFLFSVRCLKVSKKLPSNVYNREYCDQLIRASASPGANYIEALEASSRKDFIYRLKVCRKETKESAHWLKLLIVANDESLDIKSETGSLLEEADELIRIFTASILSSEKQK